MNIDITSAAGATSPITDLSTHSFWPRQRNWWLVNKMSPSGSICLESVRLQLEASEEPRIVAVGLLRNWFALVVSAQSSWERRAQEICEEACPPRKRHHLTTISASTIAAPAVPSLRTPRLGHLISGKRHYTYGKDTVCLVKDQ